MQGICCKYTARMTASAAHAAPGAPEWAPVPDSVDQILAEWARQRPDLDFSTLGITSRMARVRAHLDAGLLEVFRRFDLTAADFRVIVTLRRAGPPPELPQARLTAQLALTSGTMSLRIDRLTKRGIVTRGPDPGDKRGQRIRLTAEGLALFDQIAPLHLANEDRLLSGLTPGERLHSRSYCASCSSHSNPERSRPASRWECAWNQRTSPVPAAPPPACRTPPACSLPTPSPEPPPRRPASPAATSSSVSTA